jgi:hypothetical protein
MTPGARAFPAKRIHNVHTRPLGCVRRDASGNSQLTNPMMHTHLPQHQTDGVGFEPTVRFRRTHTFQACALNHSATRPERLKANSRRDASEIARGPQGG